MSRFTGRIGLSMESLITSKGGSWEVAESDLNVMIVFFEEDILC